MALSNKPWSGAASNYKDTAAYCAACLIDDNEPGQPKVQSKCHLPIKEPGGDINAAAVRNAMARLNQVQSSPAKKAKAKARLMALRKQAGIGAENQ